MLSFQTMNTKRRRDDDSDSEDDRYMKKSRPWSFEPPYHGQPSYFSSANLAFRPSITPSPPSAVPGLEAMTPAQSEHDADSPQSLPEEPDHDPVMLSSPPRNFDYEMDMDDDDFDVRSQPPESPFVTGQFLRPAMLNSELFGRDTPLNASSRIPTPIYPNFNRGMNGLGYPSSGLAGGMSMSNGYLAAQSNTAPLMQPPPPRKQANIQQQTVDTDRARRMASPIDRSRRMPSPISEDEDIPDTPTALTQSQLSRLTVTTHPHPSSDQMMDTETCGSPLVPPTPTRGRKRSGALTGMGRFSMGYRDDCEKCRQRVPGHYSHFLPQ